MDRRPCGGRIMEIAIVTGASSGLGEEFVSVIEKEYSNLDEVWVIARRKEKLEKFKERYGNIRVISLDLAKEESYAELASIFEKEKPNVRVFVNNAGYAVSGSFLEMEEKDILSMINLNVKGFTMVAKAVAPYLESGSVAVLVGSVSSFTGIPYQAVYSASKAYVKNFGSAFNLEMRKKGVKVLTLSPGNMDTEMNPLGRAKQSEKISQLPYLDKTKIARRSLKKAEKGKSHYTMGFFYKGYHVLSKILSTKAMGKIAGRVYE